ncbi:MAG: hypothetical protein K940chlam2_01154 [Chlamydiae bacterium]|nr:hypothetical protein [Chlamydiota bacterium]
MPHDESGDEKLGVGYRSLKRSICLQNRFIQQGQMLADEAIQVKSQVRFEEKALRFLYHESGQY